MAGIKDNLDKINERIQAACDRAGRSRDEIKIMAVSKTRSWGEIMDAYDLGLRLFGENRLQEIEDKFIDPPADMELHLIGHLQSNKSRSAVIHTSCIHSIDKFKTAAAVEKQCEALSKDIRIFLEVNTSGEESKNGFREKIQLFETIERIDELKRVKIGGLMTMAPFTGDESLVRSSFRGLKELQIEAAERYPHIDFSILSMGMSSDFEIAIEEGANILRIGTILFGGRN
ncbi:MAG: YggS family pyridoxal phosphate-dependent enzyme [Spirochaetales bacterium]|nr:YggS family pyridoxal phosphate-dependent enzyme [Spirochaetales bacterium]